MSLPPSARNAVPFYPKGFPQPLSTELQPRSLSPRLHLLSSPQSARFNFVKNNTYQLTPNLNNLSVPTIPFSLLAFEKALAASLKLSQEGIDSLWIMREANEYILTGTNLNSVEACFAIPLTAHRDAQLKSYRLELNDLNQQLRKFKIEINNLEQQLKKLKKSNQNEGKDIPNEEELLIKNDQGILIKETLRIKNKIANLQANAIIPFANALKNVIVANLTNAKIRFENVDQLDEFLNEEYLHPQRFREIRHYESNSSLYKIVGYRIELGEVTLNFVFTPPNVEWQKTYFPQDSFFISAEKQVVAQIKSDKLQPLLHRYISLEELSESESPFLSLVQRMTQGFQSDQKAVHEITEKALQGLKMISAPKTLKEAFEKFLKEHFNSQIPAPFIRNSDKKHSLPKLNPMLLQIYKGVIAGEKSVNIMLPEVLHKKLDKLNIEKQHDKASKIWQKVCHRLARIAITPRHLTEQAVQKEVDKDFITTVQKTFRKDVTIGYIKAPELDIGKAMACLNAFSVLESVSDATYRQQCAITLAATWQTLSGNTRLQNFAQLIEKHPHHLSDLLNVMRGLFLYGWMKKQPGISAYTFPFAENERTVRWHFSWQHSMGIDYFANGDDPVKTAVKFLNSWRNLEKSLSNDRALFLNIAKDMGISIAELTPENRLTIAKEFLDSFEQGPAAPVLSQQFKGTPCLSDFASAIAMEPNLPTNFSEYLSERSTHIQLKKSFRSAFNSPPDAFVSLRQEVYNCLLLPSNKLQASLSQLFPLLERCTSKPASSEISNALQLFFKILNSNPTFDTLRVLQDLYIYATKAKVFSDEVKLQIAQSLIKANEKLGPSFKEPHHFFSLHNFLLCCCQDESLQKEASAFVTALEGHMMKNMFSTLESFSTESLTTQLSVLQYFQFNLVVNKNSVYRDDLHKAFKTIIQISPSIQNQSVLNNIVNFIADHLQHLPQEFLDEVSLLKILLQLLPFKCKTEEKSSVESFFSNQKLGLKLALAIAKNHPNSKMEQGILTHFFETLLRTSTAKAKTTANREHFANFVQALSQLEALKKYNAQDLVGLAKDDPTFINSQCMIVEKLLNMTAIINPALNAQYLVNGTVKSLIPPSVRHPMGWQAIQKLSATKEVIALGQALKICSDITSEQSFAKTTPDWLMTIETTVQLLNNFADLYKTALNGESETLADAFKNILEIGKPHKITLEDLVPIYKAFTELFTHNRKAWKLIADPFINFLVDVKLIQGNMKADFKQKKLSPYVETATAKLQTLLDSPTLPTQELIETALKENAEHACVPSLVAFQRIVSNSMKWTDSLKGLAMHLLTTASCIWKGTNTNDRLLLEFSMAISNANFWQNLNIEQRKTCLTSLVATEKSNVVTIAWKELCRICNQNELTYLCETLTHSPYVYLIEDYVRSTQPLNQNALVVLIETCTQNLDPRLLKWIQTETQIFLNQKLPIQFRANAFQLACEYYAAILQKENNPTILKDYINLLSPIWQQLEADPAFQRIKSDFVSSATKINHSLLALFAKEGSAASLNLIIAYTEEFKEFLPTSIITQIWINLALRPSEITNEPKSLTNFLVTQSKDNPTLLNCLVSSLNALVDNPANFLLTQTILENIFNQPNISVCFQNTAIQSKFANFLVKYNLLLAKEKKMKSLFELKSLLGNKIPDVYAIVENAIVSKIAEIHKSLKRIPSNDPVHLSNVLKTVAEHFPLSIIYRLQGTSMVLRLLDNVCKKESATYWPQVLIAMNEIYSMNISIRDRTICEFRLILFLQECKAKDMTDIALDRLIQLHHFMDFNNEKDLQVYFQFIEIFHSKKLREHLKEDQSKSFDKFLEIIRGIYTKQIPLDLYPRFLKLFELLCKQIQILKIALPNDNFHVCHCVHALTNQIKTLSNRNALESYEMILHDIILDIMTPNDESPLKDAQLSHQSNTNFYYEMSSAIIDYIRKAQLTRKSNS